MEQQYSSVFVVIMGMGVTFVGDMDLEPFREAMKTLYQEWEDNGYFEKGIVEKIEALAD